MASDALALQVFNRFANILERYVVCEMRSANPGRHNKSDFSAFEFFIELQCVEDLFAREILRQSRGQRELPEKIDNRIALIRRQPSSSDGDGARGYNSKAQCFSVQKLAISPPPPNRVPKRITEI